MLCFHCLDCGCQHAQGQWFLSSSNLENPPFELIPCTNKYAVCIGKWRTYFLRVNRPKPKVVKFLKSSMFAKIFHSWPLHLTLLIYFGRARWIQLVTRGVSSLFSERKLLLSAMFVPCSCAVDSDRDDYIKKQLMV